MPSSACTVALSAFSPDLKNKVDFRGNLAFLIAEGFECGYN